MILGQKLYLYKNKAAGDPAAALTLILILILIILILILLIFYLFPEAQVRPSGKVFLIQAEKIGDSGIRMV